MMGQPEFLLNLQAALHDQVNASKEHALKAQEDADAAVELAASLEGRIQNLSQASEETREVLQEMTTLVRSLTLENRRHLALIDQLQEVTTALVGVCAGGSSTAQIVALGELAVSGFRHSHELLSASNSDELEQVKSSPAAERRRRAWEALVEQS